MNLKNLKKDLRTLTINDLDEIGLLKEDFKENVCLYNTTDEQNKLRNEVTWIASANTDKVQIVIITNGMLYDKKQRKETGRKVEVGRIYVDENKASMLIDALYHAFPDLVEEQLGIDYDANFDDSFDDEDEEDQKILNNLPDLDDYQLIVIDPVKGKSLDDIIGNLKQNIRTLEWYKRQNFELVCSPSNNFIAISDKMEIKKEEITSDKIIDLHNTIKDHLKDVTVINNKKEEKTLYISTSKGSKEIRLLEGSIKDVINQNLTSNPVTHLNSITLEKEAIKPLMESIREAFSKKEELDD